MTKKITIGVLLAFLSVVGFVWIASWLDESSTGSYQEKSTGPGENQVAQTDEQIKVWDEKWIQKFHEQEDHGFTTGTIDEYLAERRRDYHVIYRTASSLVFSTPRDPKDVFVIFQVRSIQGRDLLLGPSAYLPSDPSPEAVLAEWTIQEPTVKFDETKHYSKYYADNWNGADMFVIWERWPGQKVESVPIQALFYPRRVKKPNLVDEDRNAQYNSAHSRYPSVSRLIGQGLKELKEWARDK